MAGIIIKRPTGSTSHGGSNPREEAGRRAAEALSNLQGLDLVIDELNKILMFARIIVERRKREIKTDPLPLHMLFVGPPGTGKTEVARHVGGLLYSVGLLRRGHVVETDKSGLIGQYIGDAQTLARKKFDEAKGGVLFVDEAYTLDDPNYGKEAIETLMKLMEDFREDVVVVFAGYADKIDQLLTKNAGLKSRFTRTLRFENFGVQTLQAIFEDFVARGGYKLDESGRREALRQIEDIARRSGKDEGFGNARTIRGLYEKAITAQPARLLDGSNLGDAGDLSRLSNEELTTLTREDIIAATN